MNFTIASIALAVSAALGGWAGQHWTALHYQHRIDKTAREAQAQVDVANRTALNAAASYEGWKAVQRPKTITIIREVAHEVQIATGCAAERIPDGLRDALTRAATDSDQPVIDGAVSSVPGASAYDLGRPRDGLLRAFGRPPGLPGETPGAR